MEGGGLGRRVMPWRPWRCPVIESSRCLSMQVSEEREFWETRRRSPSPPRERSPAVVFSLVAARSLQGSSRVRLWFCRAAWIGFFAILLAGKSLRRFSTRSVCLCGLSISRSTSHRRRSNPRCWSIGMPRPRITMATAMTMREWNVE